MTGPVAPFAGAWIETPSAVTSNGSADASLPSRERGLKLVSHYLFNVSSIVAPFAGAWIETAMMSPVLRSAGVAPFAGAWIETSTTSMPMGIRTRRSLRGSVD